MSPPNIPPIFIWLIFTQPAELSQAGGREEIRTPDLFGVNEAL